MPEYPADPEFLTEHTRAARKEAEFVEERAIRDGWPLRLGYLMWFEKTTWREIIDQMDVI